jgi:hypothetical protein
MSSRALAQPTLASLAALPHQVWRLSEFGVAGVVLGAGANPFDPDQVAVDVTVTGPSERAVRLPAFWHQAYQRRLAPQEVTDKDGSARTRDTEILDPEGQPGWRVRFTPVEVGPHAVRIEVRRGGPAEGVSAGTVEVRPAAPGARGFVRVNPEASRYFRTDDGQPLVPPVLTGAQVVLPGLPDGDYAVTWWDTWRGAAAGTATASSRQGALRLRLPDFRVDLAARVRRLE